MTRSPRGTRALALALAATVHLLALAALGLTGPQSERAEAPATEIGLVSFPRSRPAPRAEAAADPQGRPAVTRTVWAFQAQPEVSPLAIEEVAFARSLPDLAPSGPSGAGAMGDGAANGAASQPGEGAPAGRSGPTGPVADPYPAEVLAWLERHKRYPARASASGQEGMAVVSITLDRRGRLLRVSLVASSGHPHLDDAALAQVREAAPFPAAPPGATWTRRRFEAPMVYRLRPSRAAG